MHGNYTSHGRLSLLCSLTVIESFLGFQIVKNKARDIRLFHIWCPTTPKERFPVVFPSGFYAAFGVKTLQKYTFSLKQQTIGADFLEIHSHFFKNRKYENAWRAVSFPRTVDSLLTSLT